MDIQKSIYNTLSNDTELQSMITGVFDFVLKGQVMPYIEIGEATDNIFNTFDRKGRDITENIYIVSDSEGYKEGLEILERVIELLDYQSISLESNSLVYIRYDNGLTSLYEIDNNRTRQIIARFRIIVQEG